MCELLDGGSFDTGSIAVDACPGWTVHSVVAHLVGVIEDASAGRIQGIPGPSQTAEQVRRHRDDTLEALLQRWRLISPVFERALTDRQLWAAMFDVLSHEHDVRSALGDTGARDSDSVRLAAQYLADSVDPDVHLVVRFDDDVTRSVPGPIEAFVLSTTPFEFFRLRLGRRSPAQVAALDWSQDPSSIIDRLFSLAPRATPLEETTARADNSTGEPPCNT